ncbi:MAG: helix-turn-helix domain-containing protein [Candidatus Spechtbacterales bacterium]|nr:helix-turn-helix domain-containing protein [Candidatus Spechtbacterales bacterium]
MGSLGEQLKQIREQADLTLEDISERTKIQLKYLERLEAEEFDKLPKLVYVRGFIQKWASACNVGSEELMLQFQRENQALLSKNDDEDKLTSLSAPSFVLTSKHVIGILVLMVTSSLLGYFYYNQRVLNQVPQIEVTQPAEVSSASEEGVVTIRGETKNIQNITVNNQEVSVNSEGLFEYPYKLEAGLNTIFISAKANNGETVETVRKILKLGDDNVQEVDVEGNDEE